MQSYDPNTTATEADWSAWSSVPWAPVTDPSPSAADTNTNRGRIIGWRKSDVPWLTTDKAVSLQTLDVWIPATSPSAAPDSSSSLPRLPGTWILYIHGGAWRDPRVTSASFEDAVTNLLLPPHPGGSRGKIAGLASINYRLSPHPDYPSPPGGGGDPSRQAKHPDHIADVLAAVNFLQRLVCGTAAAGREEAPAKWVLSGHSCGATLAFQAVMSPSRWGLSLPPLAVKPDAVLGFNGLYDLAGFIGSPPPGYAHLREAYREFVTAAFGPDERVWREVCPATAAEGWVGEWTGEDSSENGEGKGKKVAVLVQSREDTLVPYEQLEALKAALERAEEVKQGWVEVRVAEAGGDHYDIWKDGRRMAEILWEVVDGL
ncbi:hypothetical protein VTI74DRAFT_9550 [Chaetomium olivicolor]